MQLQIIQVFRFMSLQPSGVVVASGGFGALVFEALRQVSQSSSPVPAGPLDLEAPLHNLDLLSFILGLLAGLILFTALDFCFLARLSLTVFLRERGYRSRRPIGWFKSLDD